MALIVINTFTPQPPFVDPSNRAAANFKPFP